MTHNLLARGVVYTGAANRRMALVSTLGLFRRKPGFSSEVLNSGKCRKRQWRSRIHPLRRQILQVVQFLLFFLAQTLRVFLIDQVKSAVVQVGPPFLNLQRTK